MGVVRSLGYVRLDSNQVDQWDFFASTILGLMPTSGVDPASRYFRMDDHPHRLVITPATDSKLAALGYEVTNGSELKALVGAVRNAGIEVTPGTDDECAERKVTGFARFTDPGGAPVELFYGPILDHVPVTTPLVSQFVSGPDTGMGHTVISSPNGQASYDFYTEVLGFHERNTMRVGASTMWFLSPNARHHTLGIVDMAGPSRFFHFMVEMATIDDVGRALDRVMQHDIKLQRTIGRHTNDRMVSFYVHTPDGYQVEVGFGGITVPVPEPTYEITAPSFWGHHLVGG